MSRDARPHYRPGLGWILGVAFEDRLTRPVRLAQGFTFVRCHGSPRLLPHTASRRRVWRLSTASPRAVASSARLHQRAPRRTFTSNPVPMSGTPSSAVVAAAAAVFAGGSDVMQAMDHTNPANS